jgi:hypothetical protein
MTLPIMGVAAASGERRRKESTIFIPACESILFSAKHLWYERASFTDVSLLELAKPLNTSIIPNTYPTRNPEPSPSQSEYVIGDAAYDHNKSPYKQNFLNSAQGHLL